MFPPPDPGSPFSVARSSETASARRKIDELESQVERLLMITESLWQIVRERENLDDQELIRRMVMIDMRDGKLDGRVAATPPRKCPSCERTLFKNRPRCPYCGEPVAADPFER